MLTGLEQGARAVHHRVDKCRRHGNNLVSSFSTWGVSVMNTAVANAMHERMSKLLAVLSVACFWLLPFSPIIAIWAVSMTEGASGWSRNIAVTGAALCIAYTAVMAVVTALFILGLYLQISF